MIQERILAAAAAMLLTAALLQAGAVPGRWEKVDALATGTAIVVTLKAGDRLEANFKSSSLTELVLSDDQGVERTMPKSAVLRVESGSQVSDRLANGAIIGAAVGCAAAMVALAGYAAHVTASGPIWGGEATPYYVGAALVGSGAGALAGMGIDAASKSREVLYRAP